ncbi:hypothetical protein NF556_07295 [Ornithinimicrobium faecis]|uniref:Integral membrane protein n=1 Tax=Ornithinimicrobium faecis TaxID=2934158 RepID=A0ABY4YZ99_9MICO|nr:hypothetical protein [Ornithinimicrobium sp. HY1793]USQ81447.1 hypothetical protein NF556_07295 [Ornithinimicrobium sp. HY1793]
MDEARNPWAPAQRRALIRGSSAAGVSTAIALLFHLMAGGAMPALPGLVVPLLLALGVCILLAGVRLPSIRLLLSVGASQVLFHNLFMLGATDLGAAGSAGAHAHHAMSTPVDAGATSVWMVLAHVAAAVLTAAALRHGELILTRIRSSVQRLTWRFLSPVVPQPARPTAPSAPLADERAWVPTTRLLVQASVARRGPPTPLAVPTP